ncbi:hypothetical protein FZEAL_4941 [Fusarium zealandicum]|uniref:Major facilitator superfamily (MFS) profile domain-containing protein n=1 Tax=Fusarium zealandicum TaxID=1053134 RepID=A0A8H4XK98_9HYPO|nr:hypothetical protein FZEAL_4941 [Fusarium zealandicum]
MRSSLAGPLLVAVCTSAAAVHESSPCCSTLAAIPELKGKVYIPESDEYEARLETYYSANAALEPWCMVLPENTQDVSKIASVISGKKCPFGMRSGAHSAWKGSNGVENGITIDFSYMNATTYDAESKVALIQPGSNWGLVYETLNEYGVAAVGGRASVVGVGGFTTGGGYSFHTNSRGFACDAVANFEVVLANGTIVNANQTENSDLWKALKGGSGNFGFVTRVDQYVAESNDLWGGFVNFDLSQRDTVFNSYIDFVDNMDTDPASQLIVSVQYDGKDRILLSVLSNVDGIPAAPAFDSLLSLSNVSNTLSTGKIADLVPQFTGPTPLGLYANWMTGLTSNDIGVMKFIEDKHAEYVDMMKAAAPGSDFSLLVQFQPVTESIVSHSRAAGGNVLGLEDIVADGPTIMWLIAVTVDTAENQDKIAPLALEYRDAINKYADDIGANKDWEYLNYALGDQEPLKNYGSEAVRHLMQAAKNETKATPNNDTPAGTELGSMTVAHPDPYLVAFGDLDTDNPRNWPARRKWAVTNVLSVTGFNRILVSTVMAPALSLIARDLHMSPTEAVMALSIYLLATAFGPLVVGPLSEVYGREVVLHASNLWFLVWNVACGFANTKEMLIAARFLTGFGASAIYALGGGVLGDIWRPDQRGKSLTWFLLIPLLGAAVGPIVGGFMTYRVSWRWMFWSTSVFQSAMAILSLTSFRETYAPAILKKRAKKLRKETGDPYYTHQERIETQSSLIKILVQALSRPLRLLAFHPIIQVSAVVSAIDYGLLYIVLSSFADLWINHYHQSVEVSGLHYLACMIGELLGSQLGGPLMDRLFRRMERRSGGHHVPEHRLPLIFPAVFIAPLGFIVYGWCAQEQVHWAFVDLGMVVTTFGMQIAGMPMQAFMIDAYPDHTSSAIAASQFVRSLTAFLFPLFTPKMYQVLGYGWGNSAVAFVGLAVGFPAPLLMWKYGARLRARATSSL